MKIIRFLLLFSLLFSLFASGTVPGVAQEGEGTPPAEATPEFDETAVPKRHIVQDGENLTYIAGQYGVTVQQLMLVNGLDEDDVIFPGQELTIPGEEGGDVVATTYTVQAGDTLASIAAMFNTTEAAIAEPNHLISSQSLYAGQTLSVISQNGAAEPQPVTGTLHYVNEGESLLMLAARYGLPPRTIAELNDLTLPTRLFAGMRLRIPSEETFQFLPGSWRTVQLRPLPLVQGQTVSIYVENDQPGTPQGTFAGQKLQFTPYKDGFVALAGMDAFAEPGRYSLQVEGAGERSWWPFMQDVQLTSGNFPTQTINVSEELAPLLEPQVRANEDAFLSSIYSQFSPEAQWEGLFQEPVTNTLVTAPYGGIRSYNGGPFEIFHTGVDYSGTTGTVIRAPARGTVVYSGTLELRGGTVIIDHGLGVHSGYYHLSEILVDVGDAVDAGQIIARGGSTGLSTGPHLHWELRIMDVPVDALQWTKVEYP